MSDPEPPCPTAILTGTDAAPDPCIVRSSRCDGDHGRIPGQEDGTVQDIDNGGTESPHRCAPRIYGGHLPWGLCSPPRSWMPSEPGHVESAVDMDDRAGRVRKGP